MSIQTRTWFFQVTSGLKRFLQGDKPEQATFQNLVDSVPFKIDANDKSTVNQQGLIKLASDDNVKANVDPDTIYAYGVQPHQVPSVTTTTDTISVTASPFSGTVLSAAADNTTTRNQYVLHFSTAYKTWLAALFNAINTSLTNLSASITTVNSRVDTTNSTVSTMQTAINTNTTNIATNTSAIATINSSLSGPAAVPVGMEMDYPSETPPNSEWKLANGQELNRTTYATYFALVGTTYGVGNGSTTFNIPDCRGRISVMKDGTTEFATLGQKGGAKAAALTKANIAKHVHSFTYTGPDLGTDIANGGAAGYNPFTSNTADGTADGVGAGGSGGDGAPFSILPPYIVRAKMIKVL